MELWGFWTVAVTEILPSLETYKEGSHQGETLGQHSSPGSLQRVRLVPGLVVRCPSTPHLVIVGFSFPPHPHRCIGRNASLMSRGPGQPPKLGPSCGSTGCMRYGFREQVSFRGVGYDHIKLLCPWAPPGPMA